MGFCSRCGEPCALATCSCGGHAKTPASHKVLYTGRSVTPDTDRWERRYVQRSPATTPKTLSKTLPSDDDHNSSGNKGMAWQSKRSKHLSLPTYAMTGSHVYEEIETLKHNDAALGSSINTQRKTRDRIPSSKEFQECEETISRAFGSVLDPAHQRHKWSCHDCKTTFLRDQTVYPDPRGKTDASLEHVLYCPKCFADNLGNCLACGDTVLPDAATPFIQRKDRLWHAACYACLYCAADLSKDPQVDLYGNPCCANCFDNAAFLKDPTVARVPALLSAEKQISNENPTKKTKEEQRKQIIMPSAATMGPAVNDLRKRLETSDAGKPATTTIPTSALPVRSSTDTSKFENTTTPVAKAQTHRPVSTHLQPSLLSSKFSTPVTNAQPYTGSPRIPIASPRIAASKAFFDGSAAAGPASPLLPSGSAWNRPSPKPLQTPAWQRHRPSQSMPVIPKQNVNASSEPAWLRSPILVGKAEAFKTKIAVQPTVESSTTPVVPQTRSARPLPQPPNATSSVLHKVKSFTSNPMEQASKVQVPGKATLLIAEEEHLPLEQPSVSPKKVSAGILKRSQSFRKADNGQTGAEERQTAQIKQVNQSSQLPSTTFKKSTSTSALADAPAPAGRPLPQRSQTGLERSSATIKGRSPAAAKRISRQATVDANTAKRGEDHAGNAPIEGFSSNARCAGCSLRLFSVNGSEHSTNKIITLPGTEQVFHAKCFVCDKCKKSFSDGVFVQLEEGQRVHKQCAPVQVIKRDIHGGEGDTSSMPVPSKTLQPHDRVLKPSHCATRLQQPYGSAAQVAPMSPSKTQAKARPSYSAITKLSKASEIFACREKALSSPVFGGLYACAGCGQEGTMAETTLGPVGTRFHHRCLKCFCGKQLDSGAKSYEDVGADGRLERKFACRTCIDDKNLAKRSLSNMSGLAALRG